MSLTYGQDGYYSSVTGQTYPDMATGQAAERQASGGDLVTPPAAAAPPGDVSELQAEAKANNMILHMNRDGTHTMVPMSPSQAQANEIAKAQSPASSFAAPTDPNAPPSDIVAQTRQQLGLDPPKPVDLSSRAVSSAMPTSMGGPVTGSRFAAPTGVTGAVIPQAVKDAANPPPDPNAPTGAPAPKLDTSASDKSVAGVNNTINQLVSLANTSPTTSAAEAQLEKSDQLAKLRAIDELRNNQSAALGAARSSRNRADAGVLERAAVGEAAYLGTKAQQQDVLRQAETENNLASLRANEEQTDFTNRANILSKAADLGLNVAALQVDTSKADLGSINNYINDQFQQLGIDKQVGAQEMGQILSFSQAMSAIKYDYDKMSDADQQHTLDLMMTQYGIDANTQVAMKQIQANHKGTLEKVFDGVLGLVGAAAPVAASVITAGGKKPAGTP